MSPETALLRLLATVPASLGAWAAAAAFLGMLRVRDPLTRAATWTWAAVATLLAAAGVPTGGLLRLHVVVPADHPLFRNGTFAAASLAVWFVVAAALIARRAVRDGRLLSCVEGLAATHDTPADLAESLQRCARWLGLTAPRVAVGDIGGTAFLAGARRPVLFVPLGLWRRLDANGRRAMLLHELAHVRRRDPLRLRAVGVAVDALWPALPLRWIAARLRDAWEAQADEAAVQAGAGRGALARSLVEASAAVSAGGALAFGGPCDATLRRLRTLRNRPRAATLALQLAALVLLLPWCPVHDDWGVTLRMERPGDGDRRGVVAVGLGSGTSLLAALGPDDHRAHAASDRPPQGRPRH